MSKNIQLAEMCRIKKGSSTYGSKRQMGNAGCKVAMWQGGLGQHHFYSPRSALAVAAMVDISRVIGGLLPVHLPLRFILNLSGYPAAAPHINGEDHPSTILLDVTRVFQRSLEALQQARMGVCEPIHKT